MLKVRREKDIHLTYKTRIYPTQEQEEVLWTLSNQCRLLYNFALQERMDEWKDNKVSINYNKQQNDLPDLKEKYPNYGWVYSKVLQSTLKKLDGSYKSFFSLWKNGETTARPPKFRGKGYFFTMNYNQSGFKLSDHKIRFSQSYKKDIPLEFDIHTPVFDNVKQVEISENNGKYFVSITYEVETPEYVDNGLYQAWDLGVTKQTGVNLEGRFTEIKNIRPDKYWEKPIAELQSRRDHCKKNSRKYKFVNGLKRKVERKCRHQIKDFQHKVSKRIVNNTKSNTILVGDLSVKHMPKSKQANRHLNKSTQNTGVLARFTQFLTYKAELVGKKVIKVDERYTSKVCSSCGQVHNMPLYERVMNCDCGNRLDRDKNSSVNIMMTYLSQNALWTSYQKFSEKLPILPSEIVSLIFDNLRNTGQAQKSVYSQETLCASVG